MSRTPTSNLHHLRHRALLLAALLALAELLLPVHILDHLDDQGGGHCDVCLLGHGMGVGTLDTTPPPLAAAAPDHNIIRHTAPTTSTPVRAPRQRGPPVVLQTA